jgi:hypothetical protein
MKRGKENMYNFLNLEREPLSLRHRRLCGRDQQSQFKRPAEFSLSLSLLRGDFRSSCPFGKSVFFFSFSFLSFAGGIIQKQCRTHLNMFQDRPKHKKKKDDIPPHPLRRRYERNEEEEAAAGQRESAVKSFKPRPIPPAMPPPCRSRHTPRIN